MKSFPYTNFRWTQCCVNHFEIWPSITFSCSLCNYWNSLPQHTNTLKQNTVMIVWWRTEVRLHVPQWARAQWNRHCLLWNSWLCSLKPYIQLSLSCLSQESEIRNETDQSNACYAAKTLRHSIVDDVIEVHAMVYIEVKWCWWPFT